MQQYEVVVALVTAGEIAILELTDGPRTNYSCKKVL